MADIIAGRFETQAKADAALEALGAAGFGRDDLTSFFLTSAGQHAEYPIGGDAHHDQGTKESGKSAATTAAMGGAAGLALGTAVGAAIGEVGLAAAGAIAGAGVGGYVGSLAGGLSGARSGDASQASIEEPVERASGIMVAARVDGGREDQAVAALRSRGALDIERATGKWSDGSWPDFDPRRTPRLVDPPQGHGPRGPAGPRP